MIRILTCVAYFHLRSNLASMILFHSIDQYLCMSPMCLVHEYSLANCHISFLLLYSYLPLISIEQDFPSPQTESTHPSQYNSIYNTITNKYLQILIEIYKTLVGALTHTCACCAHIDISPSQGKKSCMKP